MNKLRLIRIYELRGKIHPMEQWVIDLLDSLEKESYDRCIQYTKDDIYYFAYYHNTNNICLYSVFYNFIDTFGCSKDETQEVMKYLWVCSKSDFYF